MRTIFDKLNDAYAKYYSHSMKRQMNINILAKMPHPPAEGNFCDENGSALFYKTITDTSGAQTRQTVTPRADASGNGRKNCFILFTTCGSQLSHQNFRHALVRDLIQEGGGCLNHRSPHGETQPLPPAN
jgi:hypothetical protein